MKTAESKYEACDIHESKNNWGLIGEWVNASLNFAI